MEFYRGWHKEGTKIERGRNCIDPKLEFEDGRGPKSKETNNGAVWGDLWNPGDKMIVDSQSKIGTKIP